MKILNLIGDSMGNVIGYNCIDHFGKSQIIETTHEDYLANRLDPIDPRNMSKTALMKMNKQLKSQVGKYRKTIDQMRGD